MKFLLIAFSLTAMTAFAVDNLMDMKRMANESISKELSGLNSHKACINNAKTVNAFKACKYDMSESQEIQKEEEKVIEKKVDTIEQDAMEEKEKVIEDKDTLEQSY